MWYENTGNANCGYISPNYSVSGGDAMHAIVGCSGGPCDWVYLQDKTTGHYFGHDFGPNPFLASGECVVERPHDDLDAPLANFNYVDFQYCRVYARLTGASSSQLYGVGNVPNLTPQTWQYEDEAGNICAFAWNFSDSNNSSFEVDYTAQNLSDC